MIDSTLMVFGAFIAFMLGVSKSGFAGTFGGLGVPLLALWMPPAAAASLLLPILYLVDVAGVVRFRRDVSMAQLKILLPGAIVGIITGAALFSFFKPEWVKAVIGVQAILLATHNVIKNRLPAKLDETKPGASRMVSAWFWSGISGFSSMLSHSGGPPLLAYLTRESLPKSAFIATITYYFFVVNLVKAIPYFYLGLFRLSNSIAYTVMIPAALAGISVGYKWQQSFSQATFNRLVTFSLFVTGGVLLWQIV